MPDTSFITAVLTIPVEPARASMLRAAVVELRVLEKSMSIPGAIDTWWGGLSGRDDAVVVFSRWTSADAYDGWKADPRRDEIVERLTALTAAPMTVQIVQATETPLTGAEDLA